MLISSQPPVHLTYCLNVVSGESFADQWQAARDWTAPMRPTGLGLRLGHHAATEVAAGGMASDFSAWCRANDRYVFTINGFPHGAFHQMPVKASVYRPDWTDPARRDYTMQLADLLATWLPPGVSGSISTVPCWYAPDYPDVRARETATRTCARHLFEVARHLEHHAETTGTDICLGLEPEPWCLLEHSDDVVAFFNEQLLPRVGAENEDLVRRRIGVCIDTCHCALAFEDPAVVMRRSLAEGIRIAKVQISAALSVDRADAPTCARLRAFAEPVYFHQVAARVADGVRRWPDLPDFLRDGDAGITTGEARVHFHVPLHWEGDDLLHSTRATMTPAFWALLRQGVCSNLEVETYTFHVFPNNMGGASMFDMINRELAWVTEQL
jgi:sugar phosphate isomerase/epimerase